MKNKRGASMREIKFRVWIPFAFSDNATERGEYISLDLAWREDFIEFEPDGNTLRPTGNDEGYFIEQFTGCYDSEGKEIYEGDILKSIITIIDREGWERCVIKNVFVVEWREKGRWNMIKQDNTPTLNETYHVIGNIHDNPFLLEQAQKELDEENEREIAEIVEKSKKNSRVIGNIHDNPELLTKEVRNA